MLNKSDLILFFQEMWRRANERSPKFFRKLGWVSIAFAVIGFIPDILLELEIAVPETWMKVLGKIMVGAGIWGKITTMFPVSVPKPEVMPFTEKKQIEDVLKSNQ